MKGGVEGGRNWGTISGWKWLRSPLVLLRQPKPATFHSLQMNLPHLSPFLQSPGFSQELSALLSLCLHLSSHWSPFICLQRKLSSFKADYKMNCTSETPYILFRVGHYCQRPELSAVTWASSWLSFTLPTLMRPDSWGWSYSAGWMLCW